MQFRNRKPLSFSDDLARIFPHEPGSHAYNITMQVTDACNLNCSYCYQHNKTPDSMSLETGKKFIDLLLASDERSERYIKSRECPGVAIEFIGGEPLLEIDLISELSDYFIRRTIELNHPWATRFRFSICSNGLLYFDPRVQEYIKKHAGHLSMNITVDGNKEQHDACRKDFDGNGSYDRAIAAVRHFESTYNRKLGSKITISPFNVDYCGQAIIDYIKEGEFEINANCVYEKGWDVSRATALYNQLKKVTDYRIENNKVDDCYVSILDWEAGDKNDISGAPWCGGNGKMISVDPRGDLYPCLRYAPSSIGNNQKHLSIGNVDEGFIINDEQAKLLESLRSVTRCSQCETTEHCKDCPIGQGCGDCAAYSYEIYGEIGRRTTFHCDTHKARVLAQVYYKNKLASLNPKYKKVPMNCPKDWAIPIIGEEEYEMLYNL